MKLLNSFNVIKHRDGTYASNFEGTWEQYTNTICKNLFSQMIAICKDKTVSFPTQRELIKTCKEEIVLHKYDKDDEQSCENTSSKKTANKENIINKEDIQQAIEKLLNFFSEFNFEPNFRFVNTFAHYAKQASTQKYVMSYFELTNNEDMGEIANKVKSKEFLEIADDFAKLNCSKVINSRLKLYYGSQGTGKTTKACNEANGNVMVCHSAMLPADLMEDFKFINGQPNFTPSALQDAIVNGKKIVLDEINLLPFESLRFLQTILDGKKEFVYKGQSIKIHDDFQIIGTMNLIVNGSVFALPEPLVDRAFELKEFKLTANNLIGAII